MKEFLSMALSRVKLVTIIAENVLQEEVAEKLMALGATGYTIVESRGHGSADRHAGEIPGQNVRIETLVEEDVANRIADQIANQYFESYSVICFLTDAWVVRYEKYSGKAKA